jgi:glutamyl-tRNA reductase
MNLFVIGLSYRTAPVEVREKLAVSPGLVRCFGCRLKLAGELREVVLLSTCNRVEVYGVSERCNLNLPRLFQHLAKEQFDFGPFLYVHHGHAAVEHLFGVAAGLDSMVIGETEITGQVKQAYQTAHGAGLTGPITNRLFQTALQTAKTIRSETAIGRGATSVGSVAVELAERIFDHDLSSKTVLIIGAGKMGEACVRHLSKKGARAVLVCNRSVEKAAALAGEFGGEAIPLDGLLEAMKRADIVVSSTGSPETILNRNDIQPVMIARRNEPLFLIDIAVPRDIAADVQSVPNVYLYNVDHLERIVSENVGVREQELTRCQSIIQENTSSLMTRFAPRSSEITLTPTLAWQYAGATS